MSHQMLSTSTNRCLNCENQLYSTDLYCNTCGQKAEVERIDTHFLSHNIIHTLTHGDKGVFYLIREMTLNPGKVIQEYVGGKRKKYFNPFNFFFITITISALLTNSFDLMQVNTENPNLVSDFISKKFNLVLMVSIPILSFFTFIFFRKSKYNFAENLVFHCFTEGYRIIFFLLLFALVVPFFREHYFVILYVYLFCFLIYLIWAAYGFFGENIWLTILKTFSAFVLTQFVISSLVFAGIFIYRSYTGS